MTEDFKDKSDLELALDPKTPLTIFEQIANDDKRLKSLFKKQWYATWEILLKIWSYETGLTGANTLSLSFIDMLTETEDLLLKDWRSIVAFKRGDKRIFGIFRHQVRLPLEIMRKLPKEEEIQGSMIEIQEIEDEGDKNEDLAEKEDNKILEDLTGYRLSYDHLAKFDPKEWTVVGLPGLFTTHYLPGAIRRFTRVEDLNLAGYDLTQLPDELWELRTLRKLGLGSNKLTSLSSKVERLTNLTTLSLGFNKITSIPESIGNLPALRELFVDNNQLASLPRTIGNLSSLETLIAYCNRLAIIPEEIGQLSKLRVLDLSHNRITSLPETIGNLTALKHLSLNNNQLADLPESITQLNSLRYLDLDDNNDNKNLPLLSSPFSDWLERLKENACEIHAFNEYEEEEDEDAEDEDEE